MSPMQNGGHAGQGRHRVEMRLVQARLPDQGRHPGDAHRRGRDRRLNILLIRLREIGDVVFTTPALRAIRQRFPDARITYLVEPLAAPIVASSSYLDELIVAPRAGF